MQAKNKKTSLFSQPVSFAVVLRVQPAKEKVEFDLRQLHRPGSAGRPTERTLFQALRAHPQAAPVPAEHLDPVTTTVAEDEQVSAERILLQSSFSKRVKSVEALAHIGDPGCQKDLCCRSSREHINAPVAPEAGSPENRCSSRTAGTLPPLRENAKVSSRRCIAHALHALRGNARLMSLLERRSFHGGRDEASSVVR